ncbi:MAG: hypothetical protein MUQ51_08130 [Pseudomonadota bacterium]|nr:hypothetical protein [Pseudomonadota bacterium]MDO7711565.1 hypothetical protein [Pseudomonadota bacterium]
MEDDVVVNALIKKMYFKTGPEWMFQLDEAIIEEKNLTLKVYRGSRERAEIAAELGRKTKKNPKMYRGHPVIV